MMRLGVLSIFGDAWACLGVFGDKGSAAHQNSKNLNSLKFTSLTA